MIFTIQYLQIKPKYFQIININNFMHCEQILRKVTVTIQGSTPPGQGPHLVVNTTHIRLAVSPGKWVSLTSYVSLCDNLNYPVVFRYSIVIEFYY